MSAEEYSCFAPICFKNVINSNEKNKLKNMKEEILLIYTWRMPGLGRVLADFATKKCSPHRACIGATSEVYSGYVPLNWNKADNGFICLLLTQGHQDPKNHTLSQQRSIFLPVHRYQPVCVNKIQLIVRTRVMERTKGTIRQKQIIRNIITDSW